MPTQAPSKISTIGGASRFDTDYIRSLVDAGKKAGLVRAPGEAVAIVKNGTDVTKSGAVRSQWIEVDPVKAKQWLDNNFRNRPLKEDVVHAYARDMANGVWVATHQGLAFNDRDELIDGQHRLHAIVLSGCTVRMMVTFGLPSEIAGKEMTTMDAVDRGRTRSVADQLTIQHGFKNGSLIAAICMSIAGICYGKRTRRLSVGQTLEIFRAYEQSIQWLIEHRSKQHGLKQAGVLAGFAFVLHTGSPLLKKEMYNGVMSGNLPGNSALKMLRAFLLSDEAKLLTRGTDRGLAELVLQAIWLAEQNTPVERLEMAEDGLQYFRGIQSDRVAKIAAMFELPAHAA